MVCRAGRGVTPPGLSLSLRGVILGAGGSLSLGPGRHGACRSHLMVRNWM